MTRDVTLVIPAVPWDVCDVCTSEAAALPGHRLRLNKHNSSKD